MKNINLINHDSGLSDGNRLTRLQDYFDDGRKLFNILMRSQSVLGKSLGKTAVATEQI